MEIKRITKEDMKTIARWWKEWGMGVPSDDTYPKVGYWVPNILAAFLYQTDSSVAFMENIISNKEASKEERKKALLMVDEAIAAFAKEQGFKFIRGLTANLSILDAAMEQKYFIDRETNYKTLIKIIERK